ncbi:MAG: hypothetical protein SNF93_01205 [Rikenellaceae bacterium]
MRCLLLLFLLLATFVGSRAQGLGIGYYDLDGLYDTIPSRFYNDDHFTPEGKNSWNSERYHRQVRNIAAVIDSMALPVVGLYGIENESVVRDLTSASQHDYSYVHRTRNSFDGQDFTLLYFADQLFIDRVDVQRNMLIVEASRANDSQIMIILTRSGSDTIDYLEYYPTKLPTFILGNIYQRDIDKLGMVNHLQQKELRGQGNYSALRGWTMHDRIASSNDQKILKSGVFIAPWLLTSDNQRPQPTLHSDGYIGGFSKYLPIFVYIP